MEDFRRKYMEYAIISPPVCKGGCQVKVTNRVATMTGVRFRGGEGVS